MLNNYSHIVNLLLQVNAHVYVYIYMHAHAHALTLEHTLVCTCR